MRYCYNLAVSEFEFRRHHPKQRMIALGEVLVATLVRIERNDLTRNWALSLGTFFEILLSILFLYLALLVLLAQLSPSLLGALVSYWIAVLVLVSSGVVAVVLSLLQFTILVRVDFRTIYQINRIGTMVKRLFLLIALGSLAAVLVVYLGNTFHVWPAVTFEPSVVASFLFVYVLFLIGLSLEDYTAVFLADKLAMLYFRQARELNDPLEKLAMTKEGVKGLDNKAHEYGLELDASRFVRLLAIRLLDHQNIDRELEHLSTCFSENTSFLTVLNGVGLGGESSLGPRRSYRERVSGDLGLLLKYATLVSVLIAAIELMMKWLELQGHGGP